MARALAVALAVSLLAASGAGGSAAQAPRTGGTVVIAWSAGQPACLNSWLPSCRPQLVAPGLIGEVIEAPYEVGPRGWRPVLAAGTTLAAKPPFTVTLHIRRQARWSDGHPVTASDIVFSFRMWLKHGGLPTDHPYRAVVRHVVALDSKTVRAVLRSRHFVSPNAAPRALPRHALLGADFTTAWRDRVDDPRTGTPIGNGPFLVARWQKGRQLVLVRNPRYWGPHLAYLDRLVYRFVSDPGEALRRGEVDVIAGSTAAEQEAIMSLARAHANGITVHSTPGPVVEHLDFRVGPGGHPALRSKLVRRAITHGIDRSALVHALYGDVAMSPGPLDSMLFLTNERGYQRHWNVYPYRPNEARRLFEQAGCRKEPDGIYACANERLSLRFVTTSGSAVRDQTLRIIQAQLRQVGVEVVPSYAPSNVLFNLLARGEFDVALIAWGRLAPGTFNSPYRCGELLNITGYCSRLVTADLEQLDRIVHPARRVAVANRADRRLARDVPVVPLFQVPRFTAFRDGLQGVVTGAFGSVTWNSENWWLRR